MYMVLIKIVFILVIYDCYAANMDADVKNYFEHPDRRLLQDTWKKYKRGYETSLEQLLLENYGRKNLNVFKRLMVDYYKLAEGFITVGDKAVDVVFKNLYLLELPRMYSPKVWFPLGSHLLRMDAGLLKVKVLAEYMVYRNDTAISYATGKKRSQVSPFSLQEVQTSGEVTIIGEECRLSGHAIATLSEQSVNLGHNTFGLTGCKFSLEIWNPALKDEPPVFERYFHDCDSNFLQNLISKPLQEELMTKLEGGIYSYVNTSDVFRENLPRLRLRQTECFKNVHSYMTSVAIALNSQTSAKTEGVEYINMKTIGWTTHYGPPEVNVIPKGRSESGIRGMRRTSVVISNVTLYGLDTAYTGHTGGPIEQNGQMYIEDTVGFNTLQVTGKIIYQSFHNEDDPPLEIINKFSAEINDLTVVIRLAVNDGLKAFSLDGDKSKRSWFTPRMRNFELNLFEISEIWARALVTSYLTNEIYTTVITSLLSGQLNSAIKEANEGTTAKLDDGGVQSPIRYDPKTKNENIEDSENKTDKDKELENSQQDLDENSQNDEESMVLWKGKKADVVLTIGKEKVRVEKGKTTLLEVNRG